MSCQASRRSFGRFRCRGCVMALTTLWVLGGLICWIETQGKGAGDATTSMFKWEVVDPAPGEPVAPHQRLAWGKTVGLGAQHVIAMFGATFVFPLIMGLDAEPGDHDERHRDDLLPADRPGQGAELPGHVARRSSAARQPSTPDGREARRASRRHRRHPGRRRGARPRRADHPLPRCRGRQQGSAACRHRRVVMLIGFNLAGVATDIYMPWRPVGGYDHDAGGHLDGRRVRGFLGRIAIFLGPGLRLRPLLGLRPDLRPDQPAGPRQSSGGRQGQLGPGQAADWFGFPRQTVEGLVGNQAQPGNADVGWHLPSFSITSSSCSRCPQ